MAKKTLFLGDMSKHGFSKFVIDTDEEQQNKKTLGMAGQNFTVPAISPIPTTQTALQTALSVQPQRKINSQPLISNQQHQAQVDESFKAAPKPSFTETAKAVKNITYADNNPLFTNQQRQAQIDRSFEVAANQPAPKEDFSIADQASNAVQAWRYGEGQKLVNEGMQKRVKENDPTAGADLIAKGLKMMQENSAVMEKAPKYEGFGKAATDPNYYTINLASQLPMSAGLMAGQTAAGVAGGILKGIGAGVGVGTLGAATPIAAALIGAGTGVNIAAAGWATKAESDMEMADTYQQLYAESIAKGDSVAVAHRKAVDAAKKTRNANLALLGATNLAEQMTVFGKPVEFLTKTAKLEKLGKVAENIKDIEQASKLGNIAVKTGNVAGKVAATGLQESGGEGGQYAIQQWAQDKSIDMGSVEARESMAMGAIQGGIMAGAGGTFNILVETSVNDLNKKNAFDPSQVPIFSVQDLDGISDYTGEVMQHVAANLPPEIKTQVGQDIENSVSQGMDLDTATLKAYDNLSETEEGKQIIANSSQIVAQEKMKLFFGGNVNQLLEAYGQKKHGTVNTVAPETDIAPIIQPQAEQGIENQEIQPSSEGSITPEDLNALQGELEADDNQENKEPEQMSQDEFNSALDAIGDEARSLPNEVQKDANGFRIQSLRNALESISGTMLISIDDAMRTVNTLAKHGRLDAASLLVERFKRHALNAEANRGKSGLPETSPNYQKSIEMLNLRADEARSNYEQLQELYDSKTNQSNNKPSQPTVKQTELQSTELPEQLQPGTEVVSQEEIKEEPEAKPAPGINVGDTVYSKRTGKPMEVLAVNEKSGRLQVKNSSGNTVFVNMFEVRKGETEQVKSGDSDKSNAIEKYAQNMIKSIEKRNGDKSFATPEDKAKDTETFRNLGKGLVDAIERKDFGYLRSRMNGINPHSNRLFTEITGLPAKTQKEADASIRSLDPEGYDKWQDDIKQKQQEKEAEIKAKAEIEKADKQAEETAKIANSIVVIDGIRDTLENTFGRLFKEGYRIEKINEYGGIAWVNNSLGKEIPLKNSTKEMRKYLRKLNDELMDQYIKDETAKEQAEYDALPDDEKMSEDELNAFFGKLEPVDTSKNSENGVELNQEDRTANAKIADYVAHKLDKSEKFSNQELFNAATEAFGGSMGQGKFTPKDAYDAMELGVNKWILSQSILNGSHSAKQAKEIVDKLQETLSIVPTQRNRTEEQVEFQQFSTPPSIAYIASWVANINKEDTVLEPSAGIGGLAVFGKIAGAKVVVNELSPRRAKVLQEMGFDQLYTENAEQINNILPKDVKPTVVIMNPPFSSAAGRIKGKNNTKNAEAHIEQALKRLEPNGRLVAILGRGMANDTASFKDWWDGLRKKYTVQANIGINGKNYTKYGTSVDVQVVVIDKIGPNKTDTITGNVDSLEELLPMLEGIRNERSEHMAITDNRVEQNANQSTGAANTEESKANADAGYVAPLSTDSVGSGKPEGGNKGHNGTVRDQQPSGNITANAEQSAATEGNGLTTEAGTSTGRNMGEPEGTAKDESPAGGSAISGGSAKGSAKKHNATGDNAGTINIENKGKESAASETELTDAVYSEYVPQKLNVPGAKPHPADLVQSAAMASVEPPDPVYKPNLPKEVIKQGKLSLAQIESVVYAGQAHQDTLPDGNRKGFFIGDGTGVGKGREIAAIILDNMRQGDIKAVWVTENKGLLKSAQRDFGDIGGDATLIFDHGKIKNGSAINQKKGIAFTTYTTLGTGQTITGDRLNVRNANMTSRLDQLVDWLGADFDGVIAFDEAHNMQNSVATRGTRGTKKPAAKALAGVELQKRLPKAKIVYVSATGATEVSNLAYAERLGLWGIGTPFADKHDFISKISSSGLAAMELVARDMKAMGAYIARNIGFNGVSYSTLEHKLTAEQRDIYDAMAEGWQIVLQNIEDALKETGAVDPDTGANSRGNGAKAKAMSAFWGAQQRFFNQILTSMQMPSVIESIKNDLKEGKAIVLQLVNTNEAQLNRAMAELEEDQSLEDLDMTPRAQLMMFLEKSFPIWQFEEYTDEDGNTRSRPVVDNEGNMVVNQEALQIRDELLDKIGAMKVPDGPMEILFNEFGPDMVAEITGRTRRVIKVYDDGTGKWIKKTENRGKNDQMADENAFMDDRKQILVFSDAGGTGRSYHADLTRKNQRPRKHYLVQAGWIASKAVQGFGRTHRSNQASAPEYILATTDLKGQKRFMSSIARRLDQLGALTKGQRQAAGQGLFSEKDNLEGPMASDSLESFFVDLINNQIDGLQANEILNKLGLSSMLDEHGNIKEDDNTRNVPKFLNRILTLDSKLQNRVFDEFMDRLESRVEQAIASGTLDTGMENFKADKSVVINEETVYTEQKSKAETKLVEFEAYHKTKPLTFKEVQQIAELSGFMGYYRNTRSGKLYAVRSKGTTTTTTGRVVDTYYMYDQDKGNRTTTDEITFRRGNWEKINDPESIWNEAVDAMPEYRKQKVHLITGALLPIWDRLPTGKFKVVRVLTEDGRILLGRIIPERSLEITRQRLGAGTDSETEYTPAQIADKIMNGYEVVLSNGWKLNKRMVSGESRIELTGNDLYRFSKELNNAGVFPERINYTTRYFIPTGEESAAVMSEVIKYRPIASVTRFGNEARFKTDTDTINALLNLDLTPAPELLKRDDMQAANILANLLSGAEVVPFRGKGIQGVSYDGQIYLNEKTRNPLMYVAKHEIIHSLDDESLNELIAIAKKYAKGEKFFSYYRKKGYTEEEIWEEFTADATSEVMDDADFWARVRKQAPEVVKKIVDIIDTIIAKFKKAVQKNESKLKYIDDLEGFKDEVAGVVARNLKQKPRNLLDMRTAGEFAAKQKAEGNTSKPLRSGIPGVSLYTADGYTRLSLDGKGSFGYFDTRAEAMKFAEKHRDTLAKYQWESNRDEETPDNVRYLSEAIDKDYAAYERSKSKQTSVNTILENLDRYRREDLESLAEQYSNGSWDGYEELSDAELVDELREVLEGQKNEMTPLEAQSARSGYYVRPLKENSGGIYNRGLDIIKPTTNTKKLEDMIADAVNEGKSIPGTRRENTRPGQMDNGNTGGISNLTRKYISDLREGRKLPEGFWGFLDKKYGKFDPEYPDYPIAGARKIVIDGFNDFASWSKAMTRDYGFDQDFSSRVDAVWEKSKGLAEIYRRDMAERLYKAGRLGNNYEQTPPSGASLLSGAKFKYEEKAYIRPITKEQRAKLRERRAKIKLVGMENLQAEIDRDINAATPKKTPTVGMQVNMVDKPPTPAKNKPSGKQYAFDNEEAEERWQASKGIANVPTKEKLRNILETLKNKTTREFEHLPRTARWAEARYSLLQLQKQKGVAMDRTLRGQQWIVLDMDTSDYDLFSRKVILDDLYSDKDFYTDGGNQLPFGFESIEELEEALAKIDSFVEKNEVVSAAVEKRQRLWAEIKEEYLEAMDGIGYDATKKLSREKYYHHQVLEYANAEHKFGTGQRLKSPTNRGFLKKREGSSLDYNTEYMQAEVVVMGTMLNDIEIARTIKKLDDNYNIAEQVKAEAKKQNQDNFNAIVEKENAQIQNRVQKAINEQDWALLGKMGLTAEKVNSKKFDINKISGPTEATMKRYNQNMGMAFADLTKLAKNGDLWTGENGEWSDVVGNLSIGKQSEIGEENNATVNDLYRYLSILEKRGEDGSHEAAMILSNTSKKREFTKETLGKKYKTWEDVIPDGYTAWQPREGTAFYFTNSISEKLATQLFEKELESIGLTTDEITKVLARGQKYKQFVIPEELAETLDNIKSEYNDNAWVQALKYWKVYQLISPARVIKYNSRNLTGDADATFTGNPKVFTKAPQAWQELYQVFAGDKTMTPEMKEWFKRGGMQTLLQAQENININELEIFKNIVDAKSKGNKAKEIPLTAWKQYWKTARLGTDFREALLRYAAYLQYLEEMQGSSAGLPKEYGASIPEEIQALSDIRDRAFVLSNQLLGAYDQVSVAGQWIRQNIIPFWSWMEVNPKRYVQLLKNAAHGDNSAAAVGRAMGAKGAVASIRVGKFAIKAIGFSALLFLYNMLFYRDEEEELPNDVRRKPHIILGRNSDGTVRYFNRLGAFNDFLEWFGVDESPYDVVDFLNGKRTLKEITTDNIKKPVNKIANGLTPYIKLPLEMFPGLKFYPDVFAPTHIRDRWEYLAQQVGLAGTYKSVMDRPKRQGDEGLGVEKLLWYESDPREAAYYDIMDQKYRYLRRIGKSPGGYSEPTQKSNALYYYKMAIKYKDREAANRYLLEYAVNGGTRQGLKQSLSYLDPLRGLGGEKKAFIDSLADEDLVKLKMAQEFYEETMAEQKEQMADYQRSKQK